MTKSRPVSDEVVLHELMPLVEKSLDRHVGAANEWFPHDYVPYEEGRNFVKEPWRPEDSRLPDIAQTALEINLLTEDNLPYYHLALWRTFGEEEAWGEWVRRWTAEEGRHAIVIRDYLTVTRGCDPKALEQGRMDQALRGWYPEFAEQGPLDGVVFTTLQELATRISHRNTGAITDDETAEKLCSRVATDENLHYVFYRDMAVQAIQMNPSAMVEAMHRQITNFAMPGAGIPGFREKAKAMARPASTTCASTSTRCCDRCWTTTGGSPTSKGSATRRSRSARTSTRTSSGWIASPPGSANRSGPSAATCPTIPSDRPEPSGSPQLVSMS